MSDPTLFHLHFNTPDVTVAAERLADAGLQLQRRFGSVRGDSIALGPDDRTPDDFRLKLQTHQYGAVNITLAPGQQPRFDHFGLQVADIDEVCANAESRGWSVRSNDRRTFVMTPWGFRVEIHPTAGDVVAELDESAVARLDNVVLRVPAVSPVRKAFKDVFESVPELRIESGEEPWIHSFAIDENRTTTTIPVRTLLDEEDTPT
ncbi:VOC family protein [Halocatena pleomorpha]|uniref:Uncharacterized protein n=1 Tax=Halocatena pleomorpha TaxID=1785090 RepID=A0A3P3RFZ3_9EURY|nr:hypothetical protein [Halocatena pleomorpha]RRJ32331.1 hypothetical protein EIK79_04890 [Halocatena pleomorpha]